MTSPLITARLRRATLSNSGWYLNQLITFLTIGEETSGQFALLRVHGSQRDEPLAHYHAHEDETIYLLEGG
jgi:quercetin dioxygenase-like cupin family protein